MSGDGFPYPVDVPGNFSRREKDMVVKRQPECQDTLESPGMLADRLRPLVLAGDSACIDGTPMVPVHKATLGTIWNVLENAAIALGERQAPE